MDAGCSEGEMSMVLAFGDGMIANLGDLRGMSVECLCLFWCGCFALCCLTASLVLLSLMLELESNRHESLSCVMTCLMILS